MVTIVYENAIAIVKLDRSVTNPFNLEFARELNEVFSRIEQDENVSAIVLTSTNDKFFSIGFDIPHLYGLSRNEFEKFYRAFNHACITLYTISKPTVAAITGHAVAGGCVVVLCCDYRFIAEGKKLLGLNEVKLGVPVPYIGDRVLHQLVGTRYGREIMESGEFYTPAQSLQMGMVDQVVPLGRTIPAAIEKAGTLGSMPMEAYATIKRNRVAAIETDVLEHFDEKVALFLEHWYSPCARELLQGAMRKF